MTQPSLFSTSPCPLHTADFVCDQCPEEFDTDGRGWVHRSLLKGRIPMRTCKVCKRLTVKADWSETHWDRCRSCVGT